MNKPMLVLALEESQLDGTALQGQSHKPEVGVEVTGRRKPVPDPVVEEIFRKEIGGRRSSAVKLPDGLMVSGGNMIVLVGSPEEVADVVAGDSAHYRSH